MPNGISFTVGQPFRAHKKYIITEINRNDNHFFEYGTIVYEVWGQDEEGNKELIKACENQPVYLSFSNDEYKDN